MDISAITAAPTVATTSSSSGGSLSLTDFYKLLSAEMQYSDPLSSDDSSSSGGSSSSSYISELCTLTQVTAIQALTKVNNYSLAAGLTGKTVAYTTTTTTATGSATTSTVTGEVEAVDYSADTPRCYIATTTSGTTTGSWVDYTSITKIYASDVTTTSSSSTTSSSTTTT
jgi:flagellar hook assembly protein FlgD